ncbi:uncharacterized protein BDV17DRAFT_52707 [Aspergillus undulatus]|uniref:uncharacterized protein n=1 Tax=Aspergillus undulatus TaxID=1810928 RepID=UPI003CCD9322
MNSMRVIGQRLVLIALLFTSAYAHSWVEQLMVIAPNGTFVGSPGYPRGYVARSDPSFSDPTMMYRLPVAPNPEVTKSDNLCKDTQRKQIQPDGYPRLQASAGAAVAIRFQENGHVTLPENTPGKPKNRGTLYIYGTSEPKEDEQFLDVHKVWTEDGTGGDGRGALLAKRDYDDGRCYQVNGNEISTTRQKEFPHEVDPNMGMDLWCQADIALPSNAPYGKPYTLYWIWDWPTAAGTPDTPNGKQEIYTTCMDVDIDDSANARKNEAANYDHEQSLNGASIPEQFKVIFAAQQEEPAASTSSSTPTYTQSPSTLATTPSPQPATGSPVATVTVTSYVTSTLVVTPTPSG